MPCPQGTSIQPGRPHQARAGCGITTCGVVYMQAAAAWTPLVTDRIPARAPPALLMASSTTLASRSPMSTFGNRARIAGKRDSG